jgi:hypothetical protein
MNHARQRRGAPCAGILAAYFNAAEDHDDTTLQAIENAPKWDKAFTLTADQRRQGPCNPMGEVAYPSIAGRRTIDGAPLGRTAADTLSPALTSENGSWRVPTPFPGTFQRALFSRRESQAARERSA